MYIYIYIYIYIGNKYLLFDMESNYYIIHIRYMYTYLYL